MLMMQCYTAISLIFLSLIFIVDVKAQQESNVRVQIEGLVTVPEEEARELFEDQWEMIQERGLSPTRADDAAFLVLLGLQQQGLMDARVDWAIAENNTLLILRVFEGPPITIGNIEISGAERVEVTVLRDLLTEDLAEDRLLEAGPTALPYVEDEIEKGRSRIQDYYVHEGYRDVEVILAEPVLNPATRTMDLHISITEGQRFRIASIELVGADAEAQLALNSELQAFSGQVLNSQNLRDMEDLVLNHHQSIGHYDATIYSEEMIPDSEIDDATVNASIKLILYAGAVYHVTDLHFSGNDFAHDEFMRKRFAKLVDEPYAPAEVSKIFRDLAETGMFADITINPHPLSVGYMALDVLVEEAQLREVGFYGGFGSFDGYIIGMSYVDRSLFGPGRVLRNQLEINGRGLEGAIEYEDRWFYHDNLKFAAKLYSSSRRLQGYDKLDIGFRANLTYHFNEKIWLSTFGEAIHTEITEQNFLSDIGKTSYLVHALGLSLTVNHTDDVLAPRKGWLWEGAFSYAAPAFGSEIHFMRATSRLGFYWPGPKDSDFRAGFRVGAIQPMGETDVLPIDTRFFIGGSRSVRSFPERELGPQDPTGKPIGGEFFTIFNAEYSVPVIGGLEVAAFFDAGNLMSDISDAGFDDMHYAAGLGLHYNLPVGPLRLDYGYNLNQERGEPTGTFHFAFGFAF